MIKKLIAVGVGVALSFGVYASSASSAINPGLTLTSNIGNIDVYCNGKEGPDKINSSPLNLPWVFIVGIFGSESLQCQFYPDGQPVNSSTEVGSATLTLTLTRGAISNVKTYNGHGMPAISYLGKNNGSGYKGVSVSLNS